MTNATDVSATPIGARAMLVEWNHTGDFGDFGISGSNHFVVSLRTISEGSMDVLTQRTLPAEARSYLATGLSPYRYNTSLGVSYRVSVRANIDAGFIGQFDSDEVEINTLLPSKKSCCSVSEPTYCYHHGAIESLWGGG